jgi:hypothetical protein
MDVATHNLPLGEKRGRAFQWGSGGWEAEACTPPGVLLRYFGGCVQCLVSRVTRGYKDGLQPESLADGKLAGETKSTSVEN